MSKRTIGIIQMVVCAALWSIAGVIIQLIKCDNPLIIAGVRSFFAGLCALIYIFIRREKLIFNKKVLGASLFTCITFLAFVSANKMTAPANAIVLQYTQPVFILLLSALFLQKKMRGRDIAVSLITLFGVTLFFIDSISGKAGQMRGNVVAIAAGLSIAVMFIIMGEAKEKERLSAMFLGHMMTSFVGCLAWIISPEKIGMTDFFWMAILGVFQLGISYILFCLAVGKCTPFACSVIGAIEPVLNPVLVMLFGFGLPGRYALFGGIIVILGITSWSIYDNKKAGEDNKALAVK
ncbi:MAG: DMT family transporter [Bacillota bacterium]|nr:DMT family transporter [Bacillota bacterium]